MVKKIKDLTIQDIRDICASHTRCNAKCPLVDHQWACRGMANMTKTEMEVEISYEPRRKR